MQGFELLHPNIYPMYELLECVKGLVPQNQSCRNSMTGQQQDIRKEAPPGFSIDGAAEARGLTPGRQLAEMSM